MDEHAPPTIGPGEARACRRCGYNIAGLDAAGVCPECGFEIERSLASDELKNSSPEYLASLHRGVVIILSAIIVMILITFASIGVGIALAVGGAGAGGAPPQWFNVVNQGLSLLMSLALAYGWWLFSSPDPSYTGRLDGSTARKIVRIALCVAIGMGLVAFALQLAPLSGPSPVLLVGVGLLSIVVFAVRFFAEMLYLQWLTPRIPDWDAYKRARLLIWLGPVLYTVGALCLGLGPLVALVLYWNLLDKIRRDIRAIRASQAG